MNITSEKVKEFVENNPRLVKRRATHMPGLYVLKYHNRVFFKGLWNDILEECRGTIIDQDYNIVSLPLRKMYNYGIERRAPKFAMDETVRASRKINGFMAAVTWHDGDILVSTTGSVASDYVDMAKEILNKEIIYDGFFPISCTSLTNPDAKSYFCMRDTFTFVFEIVHPDDKHIVPEKVGAYFLSYREKEWGSRVFLNPASLVTVYFSDVIENVQKAQLEGYVVQSKDGERITKIKSPYYLVSKFLARARPDLLLEKTAKQRVEEEYYPLVDHVQENIDHFSSLDEQGRLEYVREFLENQ